ncbi:MAG: hypothetical protein RID07_01085 [Lacipirellulaceae bacterium]
MPSHRYNEKANKAMSSTAYLLRVFCPWLEPEVYATGGTQPDVLLVRLPRGVVGILDPRKSGLVWHFSYEDAPDAYVGSSESQIFFRWFHRYSMGQVAIEVIVRAVIELMRMRTVAEAQDDKELHEELNEQVRRGIKALADYYKQTTNGKHATVTAQTAARRSMELIARNAMAGYST